MSKPQHERWLDEMKKAHVRLRSFPNVNGQPNVNRPQDAVIRWAFDWARKNLDDLSDGDLKNLQGELCCFSAYELKAPYPRKLVVDPGPLPTGEEIAVTQAWLRKMLDSIRSHQPVRFTTLGREWYAWYSKEDRRWNTGWIEDIAGGWGVSALFTLFLDRLDDIQLCVLADCGNLFLRDRTNQQFCSKRCQWRAGQRRAHNVSSDRYGKRGRPAAIAKVRTKHTRPMGGGKRHGTKKRTG